eukprot:184553-Pleurochrysis_carterae.AAC.1
MPGCERRAKVVRRREGLQLAKVEARVRDLGRSCSPLVRQQSSKPTAPPGGGSCLSSPATTHWRARPITPSACVRGSCDASSNTTASNGGEKDCERDGEVESTQRGGHWAATSSTVSASTGKRLERSAHAPPPPSATCSCVSLLFPCEAVKAARTCEAASGCVASAAETLNLHRDSRRADDRERRRSSHSRSLVTSEGHELTISLRCGEISHAWRNWTMRTPARASSHSRRNSSRCRSEPFSARSTWRPSRGKCVETPTSPFSKALNPTPTTPPSASGVSPKACEATTPSVSRPSSALSAGRVATAAVLAAASFARRPLCTMSHAAACVDVGSTRSTDTIHRRARRAEPSPCVTQRDAKRLPSSNSVSGCVSAAAASMADETGACFAPCIKSARTVCGELSSGRSPIGAWRSDCCLRSVA